MTASNVISTTGTARSNMGAFTALDGLMKDVYLPGITNTVFDDPAFMGLISSGFAKTDAMGRQLIHQFETQNAGGFGSFAEGGDFKTNVPIDGFQAVEWIRYLNLYFELTGPAIATVKAGEGSYVDIVERHISSIARTAKNQAERIFTGQANGALATVVATNATLNENFTGPANSIQVSGPAFFDTQFIQKGLVLYAVDNAVGAPTLRTYDGTNSDLTVTAISKGSKRAGTYGYITISEDLDGSSTIVAGDWLTLKLTYAASDLGPDTTNFCMEPNGIMNLVSDGVSNSETGAQFTECWTKSRTSGEGLVMASHMYDAANQELDEEIMLEAIMENTAIHQGNPNLLLVSPRAMLKYFLNSKEDRRFNTMTAMNWTGGYSGMGIQLGSKQMMLTTVNSVPTGYAFLLNTNDFSFLRPTGMSGFRWLTGESGGVLTQKHGSDNKFASAVDYVNLCCMDPGRQTKIFNISE